jgi:hypothetical protein
MSVQTDDKTKDKAAVPYWHLHVDEAGVSHQTRCALTEYEFKGVGAADPQWNDKMERGEATVVFTVQPVGWFGDWHENPSGSSFSRAGGGSNPWMARASSKVRANFRSEKTRVAPKHGAGKAIDRVRSAISHAAS